MIHICSSRESHCTETHCTSISIIPNGWKVSTLGNSEMCCAFRVAQSEGKRDREAPPPATLTDGLHVDS
eukprot:m.13152 g.13152  ORF g.13152 m.13152 type:complete len:69 (+) comp3013_c0_seq1:90-296(+)